MLADAWQGHVEWFFRSVHAGNKVCVVGDPIFEFELFFPGRESFIGRTLWYLIKGALQNLKVCYLIFVWVTIRPCLDIRDYDNT